VTVANFPAGDLIIAISALRSGNQPFYSLFSFFCFCFWYAFFRVVVVDEYENVGGYVGYINERRSRLDTQNKELATQTACRVFERWRKTTREALTGFSLVLGCFPSQSVSQLAFPDPYRLGFWYAACVCCKSD